MKNPKELLAIWLCKKMGRMTPGEIEALGRKFQISKSVLNPKFWRASLFMAENIAAGPTDEVLDMGTGCGIYAIVAGEKARHVVAIDLNKEAVRCAKLNVSNNKLEHKITVLQGDLFSPLDKEQKFDLILFSPPSLEGIPSSDYERSFLDPEKELLNRFFKTAKKYLKSNGYVQMIYSSNSHPAQAMEIVKNNGWISKEISKKRVFMTDYIIYKIYTQETAA